MAGKQIVSSMFDFSSFICMVRIHTFWAVWIEDLGMIVASSFCSCPSCARPCYILYDILLRHRSTLYFCGYDRLLSMDPLFICGHGSFRFDMAPFCILSDHDNFISYTYVGSTCIFMAMFCIWTCMSQWSVFVWHLSLFQVPLFEPFDLGFSALSILSFFLYNVFRLLSSPLTSHIRGHLL